MLSLVSGAGAAAGSEQRPTGATASPSTDGRRDRVDLSRIGEGSPEETWRRGDATAAEIAEAVAALYGLRRASLDEVLAAPALLRGLSHRFLRSAAAFPFEDPDGHAGIAVADPGRDEALQAIRLAIGRPAPFVVLSFEEIDLLFETRSAVSSAVAAEPVASEPADTAEALQDLARGAPVVRTLDQLFERAVETGATDIHVETGADDVRVRFRVDGRLRTEQMLPKHMAAGLISRVKILASLDIAERRLPQDGRADLRVGTARADVRVAVMPTMYGETAVLRLLMKDAKLLDFERIGMAAADRARFGRMLAEPHGVVIVTGPTGSGKTTTLASAMTALNNATRKIVSIEDPIEYQIAGVHQTQIKPAIGLTFATALRAFLRHDPDVIMVGEMRDSDTATVGTQAALTGHLVLTTLHTNTAADAVVRLVDLGVEPFLIGATLRGVLGQRLVRRLCDRCKVPDAEAAASARVIAKTRALPFAEEPTFRRAVGCAACGQSGFRGRIGVFEALCVDDDLRALIRDKPDSAKLQAAARATGMVTMLGDGLSKAARGVTTLDEVLTAIS